MFENLKNIHDSALAFTGCVDPEKSGNDKPEGSTKIRMRALA